MYVLQKINPSYSSLANTNVFSTYDSQITEKVYFFDHVKTKNFNDIKSLKFCQAFLKMSQKIFNISPGICAGALTYLSPLLRSWRLPFEKGISAAQASSRLSFNTGRRPDLSSSDGRKAGGAAFLRIRIIREVSVKELSRHILAQRAGLRYSTISLTDTSALGSMPIYHPLDGALATLQT